MKNLKLEDCPIHKCQPMIYFANCDLDIESLAPELAKAWQHNRPYVLHRIFPDAMLFNYGYTVFCPECAKRNPFAPKHNKFGYGYCSQYSISAAKRGWNSACNRAYKRLLNDDMNGVCKLYE